MGGETAIIMDDDTIRTNAERFKSCLVDGEFTVEDLDVSGIGGVLKRLDRANAIKQVGTKRFDRRADGGELKTVKVWEWEPDAKEYLEDLIENQSLLPCGHRAHIHHKPDGGYGCKHCDEPREYSRETIENAL